MIGRGRLRCNGRGYRRAGALLLAFAGWLALAPGASAHERWFTPGGDRPVQPEAILSPVTLLAIVVIGGALGLAWTVERLLARRRGPSHVLSGLGINSLSNLYAWLPPILALHAAIPLIVNGVELRLFVPNLPLPRNIGGVALALAQIIIAIAFLYGAFTRYAAVALAVIGVLGMFFVHPLFVLEHCALLGIAAFLYITGRGPFSVDALIGRAGHPDLRLLPRAVPALRILTGVGIVVLGFTEKLWNRELARDFLALYPLNFTRALPITLSDDQFIIAAGLVEATVGALLISGLLTRTVILLAWLPFNLSVPLFGWVELVGHLPTYGTIAVLLIWGSGQNLAPYIASFGRAETEGGRRKTEESGAKVGQPVRVP